ncbi:hypothetical protein V5O48_009251 [Marasmius crinis-equi]|uniref:Uncharacterized protein n=1 Tax=Marasmius crinis-equi TaxID=585013 RepID=A0ABR3FBT5_9AGAR
MENSYVGLVQVDIEPSETNTLSGRKTYIFNLILQGLKKTKTRPLNPECLFPFSQTRTTLHRDSLAKRLINDKTQAQSFVEAQFTYASCSLIQFCTSLEHERNEPVRKEDTNLLVKNIGYQFASDDEDEGVELELEGAAHSSKASRPWQAVENYDAKTLAETCLIWGMYEAYQKLGVESDLADEEE